MKVQEMLPLAKDEPQGIGLLVAIPTRGRICAETQIALAQNLDGFPNAVITVTGLPVDEARNLLTSKILEAVKDAPFAISQWYCLWVDDDAWWTPGTVAQMIATLQTRHDIDLLAASFCVRLPFIGCAATVRFNDPNTPVIPGKTCKYGDVVTVETVGGHFMMHRLGLLNRVGPNPFSIPSGAPFAEDESFCKRLLDAGARIAVHTGLPVAHVDIENGDAFIPGARPGRIVSNRFEIVPDKRDDLTIAKAFAAKVKRLPTRSYGKAVEAAIRRSPRRTKSISRKLDLLDAERTASEQYTQIQSEIEQRRKVSTI